ncbi:hypothetical protein ABIA06_002985 [Bradyrhizobium yuanmingense]
MLASALVKLTEHRSLSRETVRRHLAENDLKPWLSILPQMTMLPKRPQLSRELDPAGPSKPLAKRALQSAVASERLAVIRRSNTWDLDSEGSLER